MIITHSMLTRLRFTQLEASSLIIFTDQNTLTMLYDHYADLKALKFFNAEIVELTTKHNGAALSIILNSVEQIQQLYSLGFTQKDVFKIANTYPNNLTTLFENVCYLNFNEKLTVKNFVEYLSGDLSSVADFLKIIQDMLLSLIPDDDQALPLENEPEITPRNTKRQKVQESKSVPIDEQNPSMLMEVQEHIEHTDKIDANWQAWVNSQQQASDSTLTQEFLSTTLVQTVLSPVGVLETQTIPFQMDLFDSYMQEPTSIRPETKWFLSRRIDQPLPTNNIDYENMVFHNPTMNVIAKVITPNQVKDIQTDANGNICIFENNIKLMMLPEDTHFKTFSNLFSKIRFCIHDSGQCIGVVFYNNHTPHVYFAHCEVLSGQTLMTHTRQEPNEFRRKYLIDQCEIMKKLCSEILDKGTAENKQRRRR